MEPILLYDTTLRDGAQGENIGFSAEKKIEIAQRLDALGIHYIEGGWPGSNPTDKEFFRLAGGVDFQTARLTAFGSTRKKGVRAADDPNIKALIGSRTSDVAIVGKSWSLHVEEVMHNSSKENLAMIRDSVDYLKKKKKEVIFDAEHFFDGYKENRDYALETVRAAADAGADFIILCDTNGGSLPFEIETMTQDTVQSLREKFDGIRIGIHAHNDCGLAVANSLSAVRAGAVMVHGTINGYGERCGNADLTSIIPILSLKMNRRGIPKKNIKNLKTLSRFVSETANLVPLNNRPFVGKSAFAHKGGLHVSAVMKTPRAYEHIDPELVGNKRRVLVSDLSGKSNVEYKAKELAVSLDENGQDSRKIVSEIKRLEREGYQFEAAEGSLRILMEKFSRKFKPLFDLESFMVTIIKEKNRRCASQASIKITVNGRTEITVAEGNGPVSALDNALRKALNKFYPDLLKSTHLIDFKVRVLEGSDGTSAKVRVLIDTRDEDSIWSTIGVSEDIIEASWQALQDSLQYKLSK